MRHRHWAVPEIGARQGPERRHGGGVVLTGQNLDANVVRAKGAASREFECARAQHAYHHVLGGDPLAQEHVDVVGHALQRCLVGRASSFHMLTMAVATTTTAGRGEHLFQEPHVADGLGSDAEPHRAETKFLEFGGVGDARHSQVRV